MANTTNLNLVKPAGTDKALVSVINANSDKIDAFAGTTNQALTTLNSNLTPQRLTTTLLSGFSYKSWGHADAYRVGNIVIVSVTGLICNTSISTETPFMTISGLNPVKYIMAVGRCGSAPIAMMAHAGENKLYIDEATANTNCYVEIVIPIND